MELQVRSSGDCAEESYSRPPCLITGVSSFEDDYISHLAYESLA